MADRFKHPPAKSTPGMPTTGDHALAAVVPGICRRFGLIGLFEYSVIEIVYLIRPRVLPIVREVAMYKPAARICQ